MSLLDTLNLNELYRRRKDVKDSLKVIDYWNDNPFPNIDNHYLSFDLQFMIKRLDFETRKRKQEKKLYLEKYNELVCQRKHVETQLFKLLHVKLPTELVFMIYEYYCYTFQRRSELFYYFGKMF